MKKILALALCALLALLPLLSMAETTLTMGSWRADDVDLMNNLFAKYKEISGVAIEFQPVTPTEYNATLRLQLESGTGPDLMYARSYATGRELYEAGYFADISEVPGLLDNFSDQNRAPWMAADGKPFAMPFIAVTQCVYYNKDIFAANNLEIPETWEELLAVCEALKAKGITPIANGIKDEWDILECFFLGMLPNYVGGAAERALYESGEKKLNDEAFVKAYTDFAEMSQYLDPNFASVGYNDSQITFATGKAAMFFDGSWTCGAYGDVGFEWGVFAPPPREGQPARLCFHLDAGMGMNAATDNPEEAKAFLAWLCTEEGANIASENLPAGFFPMSNFAIELKDPKANAIFALNEGRETDVRFIWPTMMDLYTPMLQELNKLLKGETTPQAAADAVAALVK